MPWDLLKDHRLSTITNRVWNRDVLLKPLKAFMAENRVWWKNLPQTEYHYLFNNIFLYFSTNRINEYDYRLTADICIYLRQHLGWIDIWHFANVDFSINLTGRTLTRNCCARSVKIRRSKYLQDKQNVRSHDINTKRSTNLLHGHCHTCWLRIN